MARLRQNRLKLPRKIPSVVTVAPANPNIALVINPSRRPTLPINKDAGTVITIRVKNSSASGSVASVFSLVRAYPTKPDDVSSREVQVTNRAWLSERRKTLRFMYAFYG
jgi:hypothetical protein